MPPSKKEEHGDCIPGENGVMGRLLVVVVVVELLVVLENEGAECPARVVRRGGVENFAPVLLTAGPFLLLLLGR